jgi:hypothetical protein
MLKPVRGHPCHVSRLFHICAGTGLTPDGTGRVFGRTRYAWKTHGNIYVRQHKMHGAPCSVQRTPSLVWHVV